jgi:hypothetical protein
MSNIDKYTTAIEKASGSPAFCILPWIHFARNRPANKTEFYNKNLYMYNDVEGISDKGIPE